MGEGRVPFVNLLVYVERNRYIIMDTRGAVKEKKKYTCLWYCRRLGDRFIWV